MLEDAITDDLLHYLQESRDALLARLEGLGEHDLRRPLVASGTNLLGLVKHLVGVESGYLCESVGRPRPVPMPWYDDGSVWDDADMWATPQESGAGLVAAYRVVGRASDTSVRELGLAAPAVVSWWPAERRRTTLGSLLVRITTETAHHAGHADIVRELIDGATGQPDEAVDAVARSAYVARVQAAADAFR
jgi:hypothetical protein